MSSQARVVSLHIHPEKPGGEMHSVEEFDLEAQKGIVQDKRYFGRRSSNGAPAKRQVTLIEREQLSEHAAVPDVEPFAAGMARSNIETAGISLVPLAGKRVRIGTAVLLIGAPRDPCEKMDRITPGLRRLMEGGNQGVLAQVIQSGKIRVGDDIHVLTP